MGVTISVTQSPFLFQSSDERIDEEEEAKKARKAEKAAKKEKKEEKRRKKAEKKEKKERKRKHKKDKKASHHFLKGLILMYNSVSANPSKRYSDRAPRAEHCRWRH